MSEDTLLSLRAPRFPLAVKAPDDLKERPVFKDVEVDHLYVDDRYQRVVGSRGVRNIRRIIEEFDWRKFQPLVVTKLTLGRYAIIDGQHRATAALCMGVDRVPCMVIEKISVKEAAECFSAINGVTTALTAIQLFHARVAAGDKKALEVMKVCEAGGVEVLRYPVQREKQKPGQTMAIGCIEACIKRHGQDTVITVLKTITEAYWDEPGVITPALLKAFCQVLHNHPEWREVGGVLIDVCMNDVCLWAIVEDIPHGTGISKVVLAVEQMTQALHEALREAA